MDEADLAQNEEDIQKRITLAQRRSVLPATGSCYNCGEELPPERIFCDQGCEVDYTKRTWQQRQVGRTEP